MPDEEEAAVIELPSTNDNQTAPSQQHDNAATPNVIELSSNNQTTAPFQNDDTIVENNNDISFDIIEEEEDNSFSQGMIHCFRRVTFILAYPFVLLLTILCLGLLMIFCFLPSLLIIVCGMCSYYCFAPEPLPLSLLLQSMIGNPPTVEGEYGHYHEPTNHTKKQLKQRLVTRRVLSIRQVNNGDPPIYSYPNPLTNRRYMGKVSTTSPQGKWITYSEPINNNVDDDDDDIVKQDQQQQHEIRRPPAPYYQLHHLQTQNQQEPNHQQEYNIPNQHEQQQEQQEQEHDLEQGIVNNGDNENHDDDNSNGGQDDTSQNYNGQVSSGITENNNNDVENNNNDVENNNNDVENSNNEEENNSNDEESNNNEEENNNNNTNQELEQEECKAEEDPNNNNIIKNNNNNIIHLDDEHLRDCGTTCDICLLPYAVGDLISWSKHPKCNHAYHQDCLLDWLQRKTTCPNCRQDYMHVDENENDQVSN